MYIHSLSTLSGTNGGVEPQLPHFFPARSTGFLTRIPGAMGSDEITRESNGRGKWRLETLNDAVVSISMAPPRNNVPMRKSHWLLAQPVDAN